MSNGFDMVHKLNLERQQEELLAVLRKQADTSEKAQLFSAWVALGSLTIAAGSLATAIIAITVT
jgi:hypothetical protein